MPDSTPSPTGPDAPSPRKARSPIDQKLADALVRDREIIDAARDAISSDAALAADLKSHYLDAAQTIEITAANLLDLSEQDAAAQAAGADIVSKSAAAKGVTATEGTDETTAIAAIRRVQSAAKEKHAETDPTRLEAYYVGQPLNSRSRIEQAATACWSQVGDTDAEGNPVTPKDTLPGINAAKLAQIKTDLGDYVTIQTTQSGAQEATAEAIRHYKTQCEQIARRRRRLQQAFDTERPHSPENTPLRRRLGLPEDRSMS